jgi:hypothetical protein
LELRPTQPDPGSFSLKEEVQRKCVHCSASFTRSLHFMRPARAPVSGKTAADVCKVVGVGRRIFFACLAQQRDQQIDPLIAN